MLTEVTHLQEILQQLCLGAGDPFVLPAASEQVILDLKGADGQSWSYQVSHVFDKFVPRSELLEKTCHFSLSRRDERRNCLLCIGKPRKFLQI